MIRIRRLFRDLLGAWCLGIRFCLFFRWLLWFFGWRWMIGGLRCRFGNWNLKRSFWRGRRCWNRGRFRLEILGFLRWSSLVGCLLCSFIGEFFFFYWIFRWFWSIFRRLWGGSTGWGCLGWCLLGRRGGWWEVLNVLLRYFLEMLLWREAFDWNEIFILLYLRLSFSFFARNLRFWDWIRRRCAGFCLRNLYLFAFRGWFRRLRCWFLWGVRRGSLWLDLRFRLALLWWNWSWK